MDIIRLLSNVIFELGIFINAALFVPQAIKIFKNKSAHGLSIITFGGFNILQILTMLHGYFHHDLALTYGMGLSLLTCGAITAGILIYKPKKKATE